MPRPTKADRKKPRPDRLRPTDAAPRGPKNFKLAVVALTAIALGATFFSGWLLWRGPVGDLVRQYRLLKNPPWRSSDDALRTALAGNPEADRMMSALSALTTTELVLSGRIEVSRLPPDLKSALAADWSNRVTRLCAATLAASQARAAGGDSLRQAAAFQRIMNDGPIDRCTLYRDQWWEAWSNALSKFDIGAAAFKPSIRSAVTPAASIIAAPIGALPRVVDANIALASEVEAAGKPADSQRIRREPERTLRELFDSELSIANSMLAMDLLVRLVAADSSRQIDAVGLGRARDDFRPMLAFRYPFIPDWTDITGETICGATIAPFAPAALASLAVVCGAGIYLLLTLFLAPFRRPRIADDSPTDQLEPVRESESSHKFVRALIAGILSGGVGALLIAIRFSGGAKSMDMATAVWIVALLVLGIVIARITAATRLSHRQFVMSVAIIITCLVAASLNSHTVMLIERWIRTNLLLSVFAAATMLVALGFFAIRNSIRVRSRAGRPSVIRAECVVVGASVLSLILAAPACIIRYDHVLRRLIRIEVPWAGSSGTHGKAQESFGFWRAQPTSSAASTSAPLR